MKPRSLWTAALVLVLAAIAACLAGAIWLFLTPDPSLQPAHKARPLVFDPPARPDSVGPIKIRFECPEKPKPERVTVKVFYLGYPNEAGRPYANETSEILLDAVYATGMPGEVIEVPAKAMDRRVRTLINGPFGADISVAGPKGPYGSLYLEPGEDLTGLIKVECDARRLK